ncbi:MAG TPA: hypothetical protein VIJ04_24520, partial [Xanthobacteraceae bacterium]
MALRNIAVESRTIIDTQHTVYAAYDAANDAADNLSHGTCIVATNASAMGSAFRYALSMCPGRHCERHRADEYDLSKHMYLCFEGKLCNKRPKTKLVPESQSDSWGFIGSIEPTGPAQVAGPMTGSASLEGRRPGRIGSILRGPLRGHLRMTGSVQR